MERVRRVVSHGGFNYISITDGNLATSAEKKTILSFDSLHPVESLETEPMHQEQVIITPINLPFLFSSLVCFEKILKLKIIMLVKS